MRDISKLPKWAQEQIRETEAKLRVTAALRWTEPVEPDVMPPTPTEPFLTLTYGYGFNKHSLRIMKGISSSGARAFGDMDKPFPKSTTTHHPVSLYSTERLAWKAMRHEVEKECAERLAAIDRRLDELAAPEVSAQEGSKSWEDAQSTT